uniref:lipopolysaccharide biosynthesis protein n=1 Tax=Holdemanella porci TaxID=2652276 RepID=UPI0022E78990
MKNVSVISNFLWRFAERCGAQLVTFIVSIVLARILSPNDYGTIALVTVFITILQVFIDSGLSTALIQKKDADDLDFSSVFYFNFVVCIILYLLMFFSAPYIAKFYNDLSLTPIIRVISLTLIISGVKGVQQSYVSRNMLFKRFFFSTLGGTIFSAVLGIAMAYAGFGVWAIVFQQLSNNTIDTLILWITVKWRPVKKFSWLRLKNLLSFGWKLLASSLLDTVYNNLRNMIIGKLYTPADLAFYNQGDKFPKLIVTNINTSIDSVLLPTMSNEQDNPVRVKEMTRRAIKTSTYIMAPLMIGLAFCAEPIVRLVLTDKWLPCVPYLRIFCVTYLFWPIHTANLNAINSMGRSDLFLKLEILKKIIGMILLLSTMWFGVMAMAYSLLISSFTSQLINTWPNRYLLKYSYIDQIKDILPNIVMALIMGVFVYFISYLHLSVLVSLIIQ